MTNKQKAHLLRLAIRQFWSDRRGDDPGRLAQYDQAFAGVTDDEIDACLKSWWCEADLPAAVLALGE